MAKLVRFQQLSTAKRSEWIDRLFARLGAMYGNRFASMWEGQDMAGVKSVWMEDLAEFTPEEITAGVAACKTREWPPTLPEFIRLCRPSIDYERAYHDAIEQMIRRDRGQDVWPYPALYWAAASLGNDFRAKPYADLKSRWRKAMDDATEAVRTGAKPNEIPPRREALPAPGKTTLSREVVAENVARLKAMLEPVVQAKAVNE